MDKKRSKLELNRRLRENEAVLRKLEAETEELTEKITQSLSSVDRIRLEIAKLEIDIQTLSREHHICLEKKRVTAEQLNRLSTNTEPKVTLTRTSSIHHHVHVQNAQILKLQNRIRELNAQKEGVNAQIGTELQGQLSAQEREQINAMEVFAHIYGNI